VTTHRARSTPSGAARSPAGVPLLAAWAVSACTSAVSVPSVRPDGVAAAAWDGVRYPTPQPADGGPPQSPPPAGTAVADEGADGAPRSVQQLTDAVRNAATRDDETRQLARSYVLLMEMVFRRTPARTSAQASAYDGSLLRQLHAELRDELVAIRMRAGVLGERYRTLARQWGIDLGQSAERRTRAERLQTLVRMCDCAGADANERLADANQPASGVDPAAQLARDFALMASSAECSKTVHRVLRRN
jgi:hypothetical protein